METPSNELKLESCVLRFVSSPRDKKHYFEMDSYPSSLDTEKPLRLYKASLIKLSKHLPMAQKVAANMMSGERDGLIMGTSINSYGNMYVRLTVEVVESKPVILLRLLYTDDNGAVVPTRLCLRLSPNDRAEDIKEFVDKMNPPPKPNQPMEDCVFYRQVELVKAPESAAA